MYLFSHFLRCASRCIPAYLLPLIISVLFTGIFTKTLAQPANPCSDPLKIRGYIIDDRDGGSIANVTATLQVFGTNGYTLNLQSNAQGRLLAGGLDEFDIPAYHSFALEPDPNTLDPISSFRPQKYESGARSCPRGQELTLIFKAYFDGDDPPILLLPRYNDVVYESPPTFIWFPEARHGVNQPTYELVVSNAATGEEVVREVVHWTFQDETDPFEEISFRPEDALEPGDYFWRVRTRLAGGVYGDYSHSRPFTVRTPPETLGQTEMLFPEGELYAHETVFSWTPVEGADRYELEVYRYSPVGEPIYTTLTRHVVHTSTIGFSSGTYCARARATVPAIGLTGDWSPCVRFEKIIPVSPRIISPRGDISTPTPTLSWTESRGATHYSLYIVENTTGNLLYQRDGLPINRHALPVSLPEGVEHCMAVKAYNQYYSSLYSSCELFTYTEPTPATPVVIAPLGAGWYNMRPDFVWSADEHATHFDITVKEVAGGAVLFQLTDLTTTRVKAPVDVALNVQYCTEMQAIRRGADYEKRSPWSECTPFMNTEPRNDLRITQPQHMSVAASRPLVIWRGLSGIYVSEYQVAINNESGQRVYQRGGISEQQFRVDTELPDGIYTAQIRAVLEQSIFVDSQLVTFRVIGGSSGTEAGGASWRAPAIGLDSDYDRAVVTAPIDGFSVEEIPGEDPEAVDVEVYWWDPAIEGEIFTTTLSGLDKNGMYPVRLEDIPDEIEPGQTYYYQTRLIFPDGFFKMGVEVGSFTMPYRSEERPLTAGLLTTHQGGASFRVALDDSEESRRFSRYRVQAYVIRRPDGIPQRVREFWIEPGSSETVTVSGLETGAYSFVAVKNAGEYEADPQSYQDLYNRAAEVLFDVTIPPDPTPTPSEEPTGTPTPDPSGDPTPDPTQSPEPSPSASPTVTPQPSASPDPTPSPSQDPTPTPTGTVEPEPTPPPEQCPVGYLPDVDTGGCYPDPKQCPQGTSGSTGNNGCPPRPPKDPNKCYTLGWLWAPQGDLCIEDPPQPPCPQNYHWAPDPGRNKNCLPDPDTFPCPDGTFMPDGSGCWVGSINTGGESSRIALVMMIESMKEHSALTSDFDAVADAARDDLKQRIEELGVNLEELIGLSKVIYQQAVDEHGKKAKETRQLKKPDRKLRQLDKKFAIRFPRQIDKARDARKLERIFKSIKRQVAATGKRLKKTLEKLSE